MMVLLLLLALQAQDLPDGAVLRLGSPRLRPFTSIHSVTFQDNRTVLVGDSFEFAQVDVKTRTFIRKFWKGQKNRGAPVISPDGKMVALTDGAAGFLILDAASGQEIQKIPAKPPYRSQFVAGGKGFSSSDGKTITFWDPRTGKSEKTLEFKGILQYAIAPGEKAAVALVYPNDLVFWDPVTGQETFRESKGPNIRSIALSADGGRVAVARTELTQIWDIASKTRIVEWKTIGDENQIAWSPLGNALACDHYQGVKLRDPATGKEIRKLSDRGKMGFSPDGKILAIGDRYLSFWDVETGTDLHAAPGHVGPISALAYAPAGDRIVSAAEDEQVVVWDLKTRAPLRTISNPGAPVDRSGFVIDRIGFLSDRHTLWTLSRNGEFRSWDVDTGKPATLLQGNLAKARLKAFAPCPVGNSYATATENLVQIWDGATGAELRRVPSPSVGSLGWSPDGNTLIVAGRMLSFVDAATGKEQRSVLNLIGGQQIRAAASGDRVTGGRSPLRVWDMEMAHAPLHFDAMVTGDFLPGGNTFVGAGPLKFGFYDSTTGNTVQEREIPLLLDAKVFAFSPDYKTLASSETERSILIWNLPKRP